MLRILFLLGAVALVACVPVAPIFPKTVHFVGEFAYFDFNDVTLPITVNVDAKGLRSSLMMNENSGKIFNPANLYDIYIDHSKPVCKSGPGTTTVPTWLPNVPYEFVEEIVVRQIKTHRFMYAISRGNLYITYEIYVDVETGMPIRFVARKPWGYAVDIFEYKGDWFDESAFDKPAVCGDDAAAGKSGSQAASPLWRLGAFDTFVAKNGKTYSDAETALYRQAVFEDNMDYIRDYYRRNPNSKMVLGATSFSDWTHEEFLAFHNIGEHNIAADSSGQLNLGISRASPVLPEVDLRLAGYTVPIKNQGQCGSCWSFASAAAVEGALAIHRGVYAPLSNQQLMDCVDGPHSHGCHGGSGPEAIQYVIDNGLAFQNLYPYEMVAGVCRYNESRMSAGRIDGVGYTAKGDLQNMKAVLGNVGPLIVGVATPRSYMLYQGGIYDGEGCLEIAPGHVVNIVGYGETNGTEYWISRNSMGPAWGVNGYMYIEMGKGACYMEYGSLYPVVNDD